MLARIHGADHSRSSNGVRSTQCTNQSRWATRRRLGQSQVDELVLSEQADGLEHPVAGPNGGAAGFEE